VLPGFLLRALLGHFLDAGLIDGPSPNAAGPDPADVSGRPARVSTVGKVQRHDIVVVGGGRSVDPPQPLCLGVGLDQCDLLGRPAGEFEVADGFLVDREYGAGRSEPPATYWRWSPDRRGAGPSGRRRRIQRTCRPRLFLRRISVTVSTRSVAVVAGRQGAREFETDDLRNEHGHGLAEHGRFRLDAADAPSENAPIH